MVKNVTELNFITQLIHQSMLKQEILFGFLRLHICSQLAERLKISYLIYKIIFFFKLAVIFNVKLLL